MKKVFASDFDGTLYFYKGKTQEEQLPPASVRKIKEFQEAGHLFGLCTGRQMAGLTPFIGGYIEPDFYITSSGSYIIDGKGNTILERGVDRKVTAEIVDMLRQRGGKDYFYRVTLDVGGEICVFREIDYPGKYYLINEVSECPDGFIHQVSCHTESVEDAQAIVDLINERFGEHVEAFRNVIEVDTAPQGCSKGKGVEALRAHMGDCILFGIGDSMNDMPLIEAADVAYTFHYAPEELQKKADVVVDTIVDALEDAMNR